MKKVNRENILITGYGSIGKKHKYIINKFYPQFKTNVISNHLKKKCKKENFSACVISSSANRHKNDLLKMMKFSKNILIEKPLFDKPINKKIENKILNQIKKKKINVTVGYCLRYHPAIIFLKKFINKQSKNILRLEVNTKTYLPLWRTGDYRKQVSARKSSGGGVLNELSHEIDLLIYFFDKISLRHSNIFNSKTLKINVEDNANIFFETNNGLKIFMNLSFSSKQEKRELKIFGKNFFLKIDLNKNIIFFQKGRIKKIKKLNLDKNYIYREQFKKFITSSKKNKIQLKSFQDSLKVVNLIKSIKRSYEKKN